MPTKAELILSVIILTMFVVTGFYELSRDLHNAGYAAFFLGFFMVFSIWIFPDVNREPLDN
jgi:hypothetical protein